MILLLEPIFKGPWAAYGESLIYASPSPPAAVPMSDWLAAPDRIDAALREHARRRGYGDVRDLRPIASMWCMGYLAALLPPVAVAATLLQHRFPVDTAATAMMLGPDGVPTAFVIPALGESMRGHDAQERYDSLIWQQLYPVFESLHAVARVPRKILWGNAARRLEDILLFAGSQAAGHPGVAGDLDALFNRTEWIRESGVRPNPLHGKRKTVHVMQRGERRAVALHRQCCLYHLLPEMGYCGACPLDPALSQGCADRLVEPADGT